MSLDQLDNIVKKMKRGKACDIYRVTPEHFKFAGHENLHHLLKFINMILQHIYYLTCRSIKLGLGTSIHKGKGKPLTHHKSFRRVTVVPHIGAIIDHYMCEPTEKIFRPLQSKSQYGFTAGMSYLLGAVLRNECEA